MISGSVILVFVMWTWTPLRPSHIGPCKEKAHVWIFFNRTDKCRLMSYFTACRWTSFCDRCNYSFGWFYVSHTAALRNVSRYSEEVAPLSTSHTLRPKSIPNVSEHRNSKGLLDKPNNLTSLSGFKTRLLQLRYVFLMLVSSVICSQWLRHGGMTHRTRSPANCLVVATSLVTKCRVVHAALLYRRRNSIRMEINRIKLTAPAPPLIVSIYWHMASPNAVMFIQPCTRRQPTVNS